MRHVNAIVGQIRAQRAAADERQRNEMAQRMTARYGPAATGMNVLRPQLLAPYGSPVPSAGHPAPSGQSHSSQQFRAFPPASLPANPTHGGVPMSTTPTLPLAPAAHRHPLISGLYPTSSSPTEYQQYAGNGNGLGSSQAPTSSSRARGSGSH
jgi:hypothetical protein